MTRRIALLILIVLCLPFFIFSQSASYSAPRPVSVDRFARRTFKQFYGPQEYNRLYVDGFYPIGWSRDGKFAYYIEPVDEACGCYFAELIIQDLRTDKIVWHFKNDPESRVDKDGAPLPDDMRKLWKRNERAFAEKLRENGIVQQARFTFLPSTFTISGRRYVAKLSKISGDDGDGLTRIKKLTLQFTAPRLGTKILFTEEYKGDQMYTSPLDAAVAGVFKSPFEDRVAVIMLNVQRGWEGPPHTVDFRIAGAHLFNGFIKDK